MSPILVLVLTLAATAYAGFRVREGRGDLDDFVTARGSQSAAALGLSFFASGMGAWILFAPPEVGATVGLVAVVGYAVGAAGPFVAFALIGPRMRAVIPSGRSLTGFVRLRFGGPFRLYVGGISILYMFVFVTAELAAVGAVAAIVGGIRPAVAVLAVAVVTLAYTAWGGLRASLATDRWQAWLVLVLLAVGVAAIATAFDDPLTGLGPTGLVGVDTIGVEAAVTLVIAVTAANLFHQGYWQRLWAARDQATFVRGAAVGVATSAPVVAVVGVLGTLAVAAGVELGTPPAPFFALVTALPTWVQLTVLALGVCLVASSVDTLENGMVSLLVGERRGASVAQARLLTVAIVAPAAWLALAVASVLRVFLIADLLCAATVVPVLLGLWRRATTGGALAGAVAGLFGAVAPGWWSTGSLVEGLRLATFPGGVPTLAPFLAALVASAVVAVAVSLVAGRETDLSQLARNAPAAT